MSSELPNRNLPLDILCTQLLCKIINKALETTKPEEFQNSPDIVDKFLAANLRRLLELQYNVQISREQAVPRLHSTFELARACESSDSKLRNVIELMSKSDKASCKELLRLDKSLRNFVLKPQYGHENGRSSSSTSLDSNSKRRKTDSGAAAASSSAAPGKSSSDSIVDLTEPDDSNNRFVTLNLSTDDSVESTVSMQQIQMEDLVRYLFQVIEIQKEESRMLRSAVERQSRYIGKIDHQQEHILQFLRQLRSEISAEPRGNGHQAASVPAPVATAAGFPQPVHLSPKNNRAFLPNSTTELPGNQISGGLQPLRHHSSAGTATSPTPTAPQAPAPAISEFADFLRKI